MIQITLPDKIDIKDLKEIQRVNLPNIVGLIGSINSRLLSTMGNKAKSMGDDIKEKTRKFSYLNEFYWSVILYNSLLQFDGSYEMQLRNFIINVVVFQTTCYYDEGRYEAINALKQEN